MFTNLISNTKTEFAGIEPIGFEPYPNPDGINNFPEPLFLNNFIPSTQP